MTLPSEVHPWNYEIERLLARGGMGLVYKATDLNVRRRVALKLINDLDRVDNVKLARFIEEA